MKIIETHRDSFWDNAKKYILKSDSVLDIGCGIKPQNLMVPKLHICAEPFGSYVDYLEKNKDQYFDRELAIVQNTWNEAVDNFRPRSVDTVFALDVIEHLEKEEGIMLLEKTLPLARKQVVIFTPLGFMPQEHPDGMDAWGMDGGAYQEHKSGWLPEDFGEEWTFIVCRDFHAEDNLGNKLEDPYGAFIAIKDIEPPEKKYRFSIIIPAYNQAEYLPEALDSIFSQSREDWEVVIVNDGSTDSTTELASEYVEKDERIKLLNKENGGVASALNTGIRNAEGEWILWLSADDMFVSEALDIFSTAIDENEGIRFFHSDFYEYSEKSGKRIPSDPGRNNSMPGKEAQSFTFLQGNYVHGISIAAHYTVFEKAGYFNEDMPSGQDVDMWLRLSEYYKFHYIDERTCITRVHDKAGTTAFPEAGLYDSARACINFINKRSLPQIFGFVNLNNIDNVVAVIRQTISLILNKNAYMYQGNGYIPALLNRLREWISHFPKEMKESLKNDFVKINASVQNRNYPERTKRAFAEFTSDFTNPYIYEKYSPVKEIRHFMVECERNGDSEQFDKLNRYIKKFEEIKGKPKTIFPFESDVRKIAPRHMIIRESAHAKEILQGLNGIEIGPSSHNPFGLGSILVGMDDDIYAEEQIELTGEFASLDYRALADDLPFDTESIDYVLTSHVIEHCPDLIKTLAEWFRVIKKGGYIYMIVPLRDSSPSDRGRPLSEWDDVLSDYINAVTPDDKEEEGIFGHCHYNVFSIESMKKIIEKMFGSRLALLEELDKDDKSGTGFTLVYRKEKTVEESLPWTITGPGISTDIKIKSLQAISEANEPEATTLVPGEYVNIGMITFNRLEFTKQSIDSIVKHTKYPFVLTVIDNNSNDGTREYLQVLKEKGIIGNLVLLNDNIGVAKASNLAWQMEPDAGYYLKLDNDIVIRKEGWLTAMVETIDVIPVLGVISYNFEPVSYPLSEFNGCMIRIKKQGNVGGACTLIPKRTEKRIGYWCEDYGFYGEEDADYCYRLRMAGLLIAYMEDENIGIHLPGGKAAAIDPDTLESTDAEEEKMYGGYRKWKDKLRHDNVKSGNYSRNIMSYSNGTKSIFQDSGFVNDVIGSLYQDEKGIYHPERESAYKYDVSIVIPVYNNLELTRQCINSIYDISGDTVKYEIIVVDNASTDGTEKYLHSASEEYSDLRFIRNDSNQGFAKACNQGAKAAKGKHVLLLNNDTIPMGGWLEAMVKELESNPGTGAVGSCLLYPETGLIQHVWVAIGNQMNHLAPYHFHRLEDPELLPDVKQSREVGAVTGACMLISREAIEKTGLLDEEYMNGFEDIDYCFRLREAGFKIRYCTGSRLYHYESMTEKRHDLDQPNWLRLNKKWLGKIPFDQTLEETTRSLGEIDARQARIEEEKKSASEEYKEEIFGGIFGTEPAQAEKPKAGTGIDFSIIIPVHNNLAFTEKCLDGIRKTRGLNKIEVIVVDNASDDGTAEFLNNAAGYVKTIRNEHNETYSRSNNIGAAQAKGKYLIFLNNDTYPFPGWLDAFKYEFVSNEMTGVQGAKLLYENGSIQHAGMVFGSRPGRPEEPFHAYLTASPEMPFVSRRRKVQFVTAACMAVRRGLFEKTGGFDLEYNFGWEDTDFCMKVNQTEYDVIYNPEAVLYHYESGTKMLRQDQGENFMDTMSPREQLNRARFFKKWGNLVINDADAFFAEDGFRIEGNSLVPISLNAFEEKPAEIKESVKKKIIEREKHEMQWLTGFSERFWNRDYEHASTVLIKCAAAVGDALTVTAVVAEMKRQYPHLGIYVSGVDFVAEIFRDHPDVTEFIPENSDGLVMMETLADVIVDYNHIIAKLPEYFNRMTYMDIHGNLAGIKFENRNIVFESTGEGLERAENELRNFGKGSYLLGVHFKTNKDAQRSYPYGAQVSEYILSQKPGTKIINLGLEPLDIDDANIYDCPKRGVKDLALQLALAKFCDGFLTVDSAFFHVGHNLYGKPTMVICGITNPLLIGNPAAGFEFVRKEGSPFLNSYWQKHGQNDTMTGLMPDHVAEAFIKKCM